MLEGDGTVTHSAVDAHICRICDSSRRQECLITPCLCSGKKLKVHRHCLDEFRAQESDPLAFTHCLDCNFQYETDHIDEPQSDARCAQIHYRFLVARDLGVFFMILQLALCGLTKLIHVCDPTGRIAAFYPKEWAENNQTAFSIGPYYCTAVLVFLAVTGLVGLIMRCANRAADPRHGNQSISFDCPTCEVQGSDDSGAGAFILLMVVVILLVVLALMGIFVLIFFSSILMQSLFQRHMHLVARRQAARRIVVRDLSDPPELRASPARSRV
jgi:hypothetical protein